MLKFLKNLEMTIASIAVSITVIIVVMNVFLRYIWGIQFTWVEEVSVGSFIWSIYLGVSSAYRQKELMGIDILSKILPKKVHNFVKIFIYLFLFVLNIYLFYLSYKYTSTTKKLTSGMGISYAYINYSMVVSFFLMGCYSLKFSICELKYFINSIKRK